MTDRRWLTIPQAAEILQLSAKTIYRLSVRGELPSLRIGHTLRIDAEALEQKYRTQQTQQIGRGRR